MCNILKLQDIWRYLYPYQSQYTQCNNSLKIQCWLDFWLISKDLIPAVSAKEITNPTFSNHSAILLALQSNEYAKRGPGFWKLNNSLLKVLYPNSLTKFLILNTKHSYLDGKRLYWDMIKMEVRGFCVQYSRHMSRNRRNREQELQKQIDHLLNEQKTNRSKENISKLYCLRSELIPSIRLLNTRQKVA